MYISVKSGQEARDLFKVLLENDVPTQFREGNHITFIDADLSNTLVSNVVRVYANMILFFKAGVEPITLYEFPLDKVDCIFSL